MDELSQSLLDDSSRSESNAVLKRRWFVLAGLALLSSSNAMIWNSFSTIAGTTCQFYHITYGEVNLLTEMFLFLSFPFGFLSMWGIDHISLRLSLNAAAIVNALGAVLRLISAISSVPDEYRYAILMTGQCISAIAQSFALSSPTKVAQNWFPENQRALATSIGSMSNALGVAISAFLSPLIASEPEGILRLHVLYTAIPVVAVFIMFFSLTRSKPSGVGGEVETKYFLREIVLILKNKMYLIIACSVGLGYANVTSITALSSQMLCSKGYDSLYTGIVVALMLGGGLLASMLFGILADNTGYLEEIAKVCSTLAAFFMGVFCVLLSLPMNYVGMAFVFLCIGALGFGMYPIVLELLVETVYPAGEATASGLMVIWGNIATSVLTLVLQELAIPTNDNYGTCKADGSEGSSAFDYAYSVILIACLGIFFSIAVVLFYKCPYKRRKNDKIRRIAGYGTEVVI